MKRSKIIDAKLIVLLVICAIMFYLGNKMTTFPKQTSGNGNLAIVLVGILLIVSPFLVSSVVNKLERLKIKTLPILLIGILSSLYMYFGYIHQLEKYLQFKKQVRNEMLSYDHMADNEFIDSALSGFSTYLNSQYFNLNTFGIYVSLILLISSILVVFNKFKISKNSTVENHF